MCILSIEDYLQLCISDGIYVPRFGSYLKRVLVFIVTGAGLALFGLLLIELWRSPTKRIPLHLAKKGHQCHRDARILEG